MMRSAFARISHCDGRDQEDCIAFCSETRKKGIHVALSPLFALLTVAIKMESAGPVFSASVDSVRTCGPS